MDNYPIHIVRTRGPHEGPTRTLLPQSVRFREGGPDAPWSDAKRAAHGELNQTELRLALSVWRARGLVDTQAWLSNLTTDRELRGAHGPLDVMAFAERFAVRVAAGQLSRVEIFQRSSQVAPIVMLDVSASRAATGIPKADSFELSSNEMRLSQQVRLSRSAGIPSVLAGVVHLAIRMQRNALMDLVPPDKQGIVIA